MQQPGKAGFCVPYTVRDTADKGRGIFAGAPIQKGCILWRHVKGQYTVYDERMFKQHFTGIEHSEVVYELEHVFGLPEFPGYVIRVFDDGELINHSLQPTVAMNNGAEDDCSFDIDSKSTARDVEEALLDDRFALIAARDLDCGEELTMDYNIGTEDPPYYDALCEQYGVTWAWM